jgi:predicted nucleic acid-binding protein
MIIPPSLVLVDASIWIRFLRDKKSEESLMLDTLLAVGEVATCAPVRAEVVSGASTERQFQHLDRGLASTIQLDMPDDAWQRVTMARFQLARCGFQIAVTDLMIAITAQAHNACVWSLDMDFERIATVVPMHRYAIAPVPA